MIHSPCLDCPDRHRACWDSCERYREYQAVLQKQKDRLNFDKEVRHYNLDRWKKRQEFCRRHKIIKRRADQ